MDAIFKDLCSKDIQNIILDYKNQMEIGEKLNHQEKFNETLKYIHENRVNNYDKITYRDGKVIYEIVKMKMIVNHISPNGLRSYGKIKFIPSNGCLYNQQGDFLGKSNHSECFTDLLNGLEERMINEQSRELWLC